METVLTAIIVIFIILFAVLTLTQVFVLTQDRIAFSREEMEIRWIEQANTHLRVLAAETADGGTHFSLVLANDGSNKWADFNRWDVIVQYYDTADPAVYRTLWLPFSDTGLSDNTWTMAGIYLGESLEQAEIFDPGLVNPGETARIQAQLNPPAAPGSGIQMVISATSGSGTSSVFTANIPPVIVVNEALTVASGGSRAVDSSLLAASDSDDDTDTLIYTVVTPPAQGTLSLGDTFTQQDINDGALIYTHTGTGEDSFQFTVSDGKDTSEIYTFTILASEPPVLTANTPVIVATGGMGWFGPGVLETSDPDDAPANLVYTIVVPPAQGNLSLGDTFTQENINNGELIYTHTGTGGDSFQFTVSDGETTIGVYTFTFTVY
ncbi:MAG: hypothetical protein H6671_16380 [Anaerolineaceae bacterium]|nr:hypothetical protein [Anaerolineaceae bacterium]